MHFWCSQAYWYKNTIIFVQFSLVNGVFQWQRQGAQRRMHLSDLGHLILMSHKKSIESHDQYTFSHEMCTRLTLCQKAGFQLQKKGESGK